MAPGADREAAGARFAGQVAVVTGAGGGIGRALALGVAAEGADVACLDVVVEQAEATARAVRETGGRAVAVGCDAAAEQEMTSAFRLIERELGPVRALFASAGGSRGETVPFLDLDLRQWRSMLDRNLTSVFVTGHVAARHMAQHGGGTIVIVSSQLSEVVRPGLAHYCAAKGGVRQLIKAMAVDLVGHRIRVNGIAPGPTMTPGNREWFERPDVAAAHERAIPLGRVGRAEEVVGGALYLASDEASFAVGTTLIVDGGYTLL